MNKDKKFKCPHCGSGKGTWFDRTFILSTDGKDLGPFDRCESCGMDVNERKEANQKIGPMTTKGGEEIARVDPAGHLEVLGKYQIGTIAEFADILNHVIQEFRDDGIREFAEKVLEAYEDGEMHYPSGRFKKYILSLLPKPTEGEGKWGG